MKKQMTIQEAIEYIKNEDTNDDFAFRGDNFIPSGAFNNSFYHPSDIDDGEEYELDGVSAIKVVACEEQYIVKAAKMAKKYGKNLFLLQGCADNADEENHDPGECLMTEHKIVCLVVDDEK